MSLEKLLADAQDAMNVRRVYGEPYQQDGITIIPAAKVRGGGGGGTGRAEDERTRAWGGGFGLSAKPVGAYVVRDGVVTWVPAVDVNRALLVAGLAAFWALLTIRSVTKTLARRR